MKACQLCGHKGWFEVDAQDGGNTLLKFVECSFCHAQTKSFETNEEAGTAWNRGEITLPKWDIND